MLSQFHFGVDVLSTMQATLSIAVNNFAIVAMTTSILWYLVGLSIYRPFCISMGEATRMDRRGVCSATGQLASLRSRATRILPPSLDLTNSNIHRR
jgi:hypothetical protein